MDYSDSRYYPIFLIKHSLSVRVLFPPKAIDRLGGNSYNKVASGIKKDLILKLKLTANSNDLQQGNADVI